MAFGKAKKQQVSNHTEITDKKEQSEIEKILYRLDEDEKVLCVARQSRIKPGGSNITTPNTIFATDKRLIIRNPTMLGMRESVEDYSYDKITNIKLEKGVFSSTLVITAPGMGTASRTGRSNGLVAWGRGEDGMIDAIPKNKAEQLLDLIRNGMENFKRSNNSITPTSSMADELAKYAKLKEQGVLTDEEFNQFKQNLLDKISQAKGEKVKISD